MTSFGKRLATLRKELKLSQTDLAKSLSTSISVISRYEREEMLPSIATAKKLADLLNTSVGYLLGEEDSAEVFKDPDMLRRFKDILKLDGEEKKYVLFTLDAMIRDIKLRQLAQS